jgi:hypothetical protein
MLSDKYFLQISYLVGCRNCLKSNGLRHVLNYTTPSKNELYEMTEYELVNKLKEWLGDSPSLCPFCGSANVELSHTAINDGIQNYESYNFERLANTYNRAGQKCFWQFSLTKKNNNFTLDIGGTDPQYVEVERAASAKILWKLAELPESIFKPHERGWFFVCYSVKIITEIIENEDGNGNDEEFENNFQVILDLKLERLICHGMSRMEVIKQLREYHDSLFS